MQPRPHRPWAIALNQAMFEKLWVIGAEIVGADLTTPLPSYLEPICRSASERDDSAPQGNVRR